VRLRSYTLLVAGVLTGCQVIAGLTNRRAALAESCVHNSDCAVNDVCIFQTCTTECTQDRDCAVGSRCLLTQARAGCVSSLQPACSGDSECPAGTRCVEAACRTRCGPGNTASCLDGQTCTSEGTCVGMDPMHDSAASGGTGGSDAGTPVAGSGGVGKVCETSGGNAGQSNIGGSSGVAGMSGAPAAGGTPSTDGPSISITELPMLPSGKPGLIVTGPDGSLWFNNETAGPNSITRMSPSGMFTQFVTGVTDVGPVGIAAGSDGNVWYTKQQGIGLVTPEGKITERVIPGGRDSGYVTRGPDGNMWFTEPVANRIGRVSPAGIFNEYAVPTADAGPFSIATGPDGNLWFTEQHSAGNKIGRMTPAGAFTEFPIPTPASNAFSIAAGTDGMLWFTGHNIGRITPAGRVAEFAVPSGGSPATITAGPDSNIWFVEPSNNAIGRITRTGAIAEYAIPTPRSAPTGICAGPDNNIYFTELDADQVGRVSNLMGGGTILPGLKPR
jgi:virginiamycin B lyase